MPRLSGVRNPDRLLAWRPPFLVPLSVAPAPPPKATGIIALVVFAVLVGFAAGILVALSA